LKVEIELKNRGAGADEVRQVSVEPRDLSPGESGKYSLQIAPKSWGGASVVKLLSASPAGEVQFKPEIGAKRPPEGRPVPKVIIVPRPKPQGDDFINTPDTPLRIP
jgi:hypothetical protein